MTETYLLPDGLPRPLLRGHLHLGAFVVALALGVTLVLVAGVQDGPAFAVYGLAVAGEPGVREVLRNFMADFDLTMGLAGCGSVEAIDRQTLVRAA